MSGKVFCSIIISWFLPVLARVPGLVSLLSFFFFPFSGRGLCSIMIFWFLLVPGSGSGPCLPSLLSFLFSGMGQPMSSLLHMNVVETWFVAVWVVAGVIYFPVWFPGLGALHFSGHLAATPKRLSACRAQQAPCGRCDLAGLAVAGGADA